MPKPIIGIMMKMPKCCNACPLNYDYLYCAVTKSEISKASCNIEKLPDCPLMDYTVFKISDASIVGDRPHGEWKFIGKYTYECSLCNESICGNLTRYCPNCGAMMKIGE